MALERCIRKCFYHDRLWEVGEVRTTNELDDGGQPVVTSDNFRLIESDERIDDRKVYKDEELAEKRRESGLRDKRGGILRALSELDHSDNSHWTKQGWPNLQAVASRCDFEVTRADITVAAPDMERHKSNK